MEEHERQVILSVLELHHFNQGKTADHLKLSRHQLRYRMQRLNIHVETESEEATTSTGRDSAR
jgi:transcriptional regulator with GAF, ATPase, and Fis domain